MMGDSTALMDIREVPAHEVISNAVLMIRLAELVPVCVPKNAQAIEDARAIKTVDDADCRDYATLTAQAVAGAVKEITAHYKPYEEAAFRLHREIVALKKEAIDPVDREGGRIKGLIMDYNRAEAEAERRRVEEENRKRREEAEAERKRLESIAQAEAERLEAAGRTAEAAEVVEQAITAPTVMIPEIVPERPKASGVGGSSMRITYSARLVSLADLVKAAAENPAYLQYLALNEQAANATARAVKTNFAIPGLQLVTSETLAVKSK